MAKNTTRDPMYGESKIKGGKHKGPVTLPPIKKAGKGGSPGQPYDDPEKGKGPFVPAPGKVAKKKKGHDVDGKDISWT